MADQDLLRLSLEELCAEASSLRDRGKGRTVTFSPKVFIPLTRLCRNACGYCDFRSDEPVTEPFLPLDDVLALARLGEWAGCKEALLISGDKPEKGYESARLWLENRGFKSTAEYAGAAARLILRETRLLPHTNCGIVSEGDLEMLADANASLGLMLETISSRLSHQHVPHVASPDKLPGCRLKFLASCGKHRIPTTTGLLVGIGETRSERLEALCAIRAVHRDFGHIQEVIIQNFRPKAGTAMADWAAPDLGEMLWTTAAARIVLGPRMNLQVPPNLVGQLPGVSGNVAIFLGAGINDWGGVSPVTRDGVNREAPWPSLDDLRRETESCGFILRARFPVYPEFVRKPGFLRSDLAVRIAQARDKEGYVREVTLAR